MVQVTKKILVLVALFTVIFSTCHADTLKISSISAEDFLANMRGVLYSDSIQKEFPIALTDLVRGEESDLKEYNLKVWSSFFGKQGSENPDGEVTFFVDTTGNVHSLKITLRENENSVAEYANVFAAICHAIGLTEDEARNLFVGGKSEEPGFYHSELEQKDKVIFVITTLDEGITRTLFIAGDGNG